MTRKILFFIIYIIVASFSSLHAVSPQEAAKAMKEGAPEKAIEIYDSIAAQQGVSAELYANLGNAWYEEGNTGMAVLNLLRSHRLNPSDRQVNANLSFLRSRVVDANKMEIKDKKGNLDPDETTFSQSVKSFIAVDHTSNMWATWAAILFVIAVGSIALYFFTPSVGVRKVGFFTALIALASCVIFVIFAFMAASVVRSTDEAVVVVPKAELHSQPMAESEASATPLHSGSEVVILQRNSDGWVKVFYNSHTEGWTNESNIIQVVEN